MTSILTPGDAGLFPLCKDRSMGADFSTTLQAIGGYVEGSIQAFWTGSNSVVTKARIVPEVSLDGENWCGVFPDEFIQRVDATNGCKMYTMPSMAFKYARVRFAHGSNTAGTITILLYMKERSNYVR